MTDFSALFPAARPAVPLAPFTSARIGGPAEWLLSVTSADELAQAALLCWEKGLSFTLLGGGSNVLLPDEGLPGLTILNRAKETRFFPGAAPRLVAETGVVFANLAHRAAAQGLGGLEWAASVPGTVGGAVYGNAGAFGGDVARDLLSARVLTPQGEKTFSAQELGYGYRASIFKRGEIQGVILSAEFSLQNRPAAELLAQMETFAARRKATQPPGASMGSMFRNPPGDYAGRLIEAAGLKGTRIGNAQISPAHANFIINTGQTRAADVLALLTLARQTVLEKFDISLELEIEIFPAASLTIPF